MTRVVNNGFAQVVIAHMSKCPISVEKAVAGAADAENPRCPDCGNRTVFVDGLRGQDAFFYCEADCGWRQSIKRSEETYTRHQQPVILPFSVFAEERPCLSEVWRRNSSTART